jgi:hypothetical protein
MTIRTMYYTDAGGTPGKIYRVRDGVTAVHYTRSRGRIYSIAFSKTGKLYFTDANGTDIYRVFSFWFFRFALRVYRHATYVRGLAFDRDGSFYFSEATGAGGNGRIYRLAGGVATVFREIPLAGVGGFWAGDFVFGAQNELYVSSGNRVPASIFREADEGWTEVFTDATGPVKGMALLACGLLCYANWRSEIYLVDVRTAARETAHVDPFRIWLADVALCGPQISEPTLYEGTKQYRCDGTCWRDDGTVDAGWSAFFPDINASSPDIQALLDDIGAPAAPTDDDGEIWSRTRTVWAWLQQHGLWPGQAQYDEAMAYRAGLGHWPSIAEFAHLFAAWGGFAWGGCTCMCRAQTFATLLYRAGIPPDRLSIGEARWKPEYSQHMYLVLRIGCRWYYVDPSDNVPELGTGPQNTGSGAADYRHPNNLILVPGSTLSRPMLVR